MTNQEIWLRVYTATLAAMIPGHADTGQMKALRERAIKEADAAIFLFNDRFLDRKDK